MYQFFVPPENIQGNRVVITGEDVNHIKNVLRMKEGEEIAVSNGEDGKEYRCGILELGEEILCELRFIKEDDIELPSKITLFQGLPKADKMELIIQKAVELGVYRIIPVDTRRTVVRLDAKKEESKVKRWNAISESAAKQSKRSLIPEVSGVMSFKDALAETKDYGLKMIPYECAEGMGQTRELIKRAQAGMDIAVFIGPEGGFEEDEIEKAQAAGVLPVTLGKRILRTETAGLCILSALMLQLEEE